MSADPNEHVIEIEGLMNAIGDGQILHKDLNLKVRARRSHDASRRIGKRQDAAAARHPRVEAPLAGAVRVFGVSWDDPSFKKVRDARRRMGVLFQNGALFSALTVFDNVAFPLRERGRPEEDRAIVHPEWSWRRIMGHCCRQTYRAAWLNGSRSRASRPRTGPADPR